MVAYNHPMERYKEGRAKYFSTVAGDTRGGGDSLLFGRSRSDFRIKTFTRRGVQYWNRLPREAVKSPCPEAFETWPGKAAAALV